MRLGLRIIQRDQRINLGLSQTDREPILTGFIGEIGLTLGIEL